MSIQCMHKKVFRSKTFQFHAFSVPESVEQKYDFEPATGHTFFCLDIFLLHINISESAS
jgi:hypothetical protein